MALRLLLLLALVAGVQAAVLSDCLAGEFYCEWLLLVVLLLARKSLLVLTPFFSRSIRRGGGRQV